MTRWCAIALLLVGCDIYDIGPALAALDAGGGEPSLAVYDRCGPDPLEALTGGGELDLTVVQTTCGDRRREPGEVALHVGDEHRDADRRKALGEPLQRHRLAGAGRPSD